MKIGIIGGGVVGQAMARAFIEHVKEVRIYDIQKERATHYISEVNCWCDLEFVCLPETELDLFFNNQERVGQSKLNMVLKSTVPIGTTRRLSKQYNLPNLVHSPEFLTARCANTMVQMPTRNIIGWSPVDQDFTALITWSQGNKAAETLNTLYHQRWPHVPVLLMNSDESEALKLFQNGFFAVKVAFWNECRTLSDKLGLSWGRVINAILADGRISPSHTQVPGPDGKRGFGGACLEKDLQHLIKCLLDNDLSAVVCAAAGARNQQIDRKE